MEVRRAHLRAAMVWALASSWPERREAACRPAWACSSWALVVGVGVVLGEELRSVEHLSAVAPASTSPALASTLATLAAAWRSTPASSLSLCLGQGSGGGRWGQGVSDR